MIKLLNASVALMLPCANQLTGFYMRETLAFNGLKVVTFVNVGKNILTFRNVLVVVYL